MAEKRIEIVKQYYEDSYKEKGLNAQRLYPNEELLRFFGREFFSKIDRNKRGHIKVLELGCGSCSNLWMVSKEGFDSYGLDLSEEAVNLGQEMLSYWGCSANLEVGSMVNLPYEDGYFDVIFDVFSAASLYEEAFLACLDDVSRCLKAGGRFFSYSPSDKSDAYKKHSPAKKIDPWTLDGIKRIDSAYYGQAYPFRFISKDHYKEVLLERNFNVSYLESVGRTYSSGNEYFEFITVAGEKNRLHS